MGPTCQRERKVDAPEEHGGRARERYPSVIQYDQHSYRYVAFIGHARKPTSEGILFPARTKRSSLNAIPFEGERYQVPIYWIIAREQFNVRRNSSDVGPTFGSTSLKTLSGILLEEAHAAIDSQIFTRNITRRVLWRFILFKDDSAVVRAEG